MQPTQASSSLVIPTSICRQNDPNDQKTPAKQFISGMLAKLVGAPHSLPIMNSKVAVVLLVAICALLGVGLLMTHNQALTDKEENTNLVGQLRNELDALKAASEGATAPAPPQAQPATTQTGAASPAPTPTPSAATNTVTVQNPVNSELQSALQKAKSDALAAREAVAKARAAAEEADKLIAAERAKTEQAKVEAATKLANLEKSKDTAIAALDKRVVKLATDKEELNKTVTNLNGEIGKLNTTITTLKSQMATAEKELETTKGDKEFLLKELQRMQTDKEEMENHMNDLEFVREQLSRLKTERNVARRIELIRKGVYLTGHKGAKWMVARTRGQAKPKMEAGEKIAPSPLEVEMKKDGTVSIKPAEPAPEQKPENPGELKPKQ
tara:strand:- start:3979 stop:5130 length:1152 start_codon:yes stop_codon:yes gene_type:complete